jgi:uncharacterized protein
MSFSIPIRDSASGASFAVRVQPRGSRTAILGSLGEALKLTLSAPPEDGKANQELIEFFSRIFHVPRAAVEIVSGGHLRNKIIRVAGASSSELQLALQEYLKV